LDLETDASLEPEQDKDLAAPFGQRLKSLT